MSILDTLPQYRRRHAPERTMRAARIELVVHGDGEADVVCRIRTAIQWHAQPIGELLSIKRPSLDVGAAKPGDWFCVLDNGREVYLDNATFHSLVAELQDDLDYDIDPADYAGVTDIHRGASSTYSQAFAQRQGGFNPSDAADAASYINAAMNNLYRNRKP